MSGVNPDIQFFIFGNHGVLFHPEVSKLWVLNPVAATVWCLLPECSVKDGLHVQVATRFGIGSEQAKADVTQCLEYFAHEGLLEGGQPTAPERVNLLDIRLDDSPWVEPEGWQFEAVINAPGATVHFCSEDLQLGEQFMAFLGHLQGAGDPGKIDAKIVLAREKGRTGWSVFLDGRRYVGGVADNAVLPHVYFLLFVCATRGLERYFLVHGAVLEREGKVLILPGEAKSGKTTLVALLAKQGWQFYSDELVVLDVDKGEVFPFPMPMSIKPGSLEVLLPYYPELRSAQLWNRVDGQQVRYLLPPLLALPVSLHERALPTTLIFPKYVPGGGTRLQELDKVETLKRLAVTGSSNRPLRSSDVEALIALVGRCPGYSLVYDDVERASALPFSDCSDLG